MTNQRLHYYLRNDIGASELGGTVLDYNLLDGVFIKLSILGVFIVAPTASTVSIIGFGLSDNPEIATTVIQSNEDSLDLFEDFSSNSMEGMAYHGNPDEMIDFYFLISDDIVSADDMFFIEKIIRRPVASGNILRVRHFHTPLVGTDVATDLNFVIEAVQSVEPQRWK